MSDIFAEFSHETLFSVQDIRIYKLGDNKNQKKKKKKLKK